MSVSVYIGVETAPPRIFLDEILYGGFVTVCGHAEAVDTVEICESRDRDEKKIRALFSHN